MMEQKSFQRVFFANQKPGQCLAFLSGDLQNVLKTRITNGRTWPKTLREPVSAFSKPPNAVLHNSFEIRNSQIVLITAVMDFSAKCDDMRPFTAAKKSLSSSGFTIATTAQT